LIDGHAEGWGPKAGGPTRTYFASRAPSRLANRCESRSGAAGRKPPPSSITSAPL
jgi:hypothetical protein